MGIGQKRQFRGQSGFSYSTESLDYLFWLIFKKKKTKRYITFFLIIYLLRHIKWIFGVLRRNVKSGYFLDLFLGL